MESIRDIISAAASYSNLYCNAWSYERTAEDKTLNARTLTQSRNPKPQTPQPMNLKP